MLTTAQTKFLRSHAHYLNPVLWVGASGVTEAVIAELDQTLTTHELIKIKLLNDDREQRQAMVEALCQASGALKVQTIGKVAILYRANPKQPKLSLPR
ncbi:MAG: ribosome assembly RNA-binding protein YhbY [Thiotrichales bacterium]|jgi:RNA-binding protein|nr:ribosome assembly RNA-binding protein YhbY [Thiotrichales bacterium]